MCRQFLSLALYQIKPLISLFVTRKGTAELAVHPSESAFDVSLNCSLFRAYLLPFKSMLDSLADVACFLNKLEHLC